MSLRLPPITNALTASFPIVLCAALTCAAVSCACAAAAFAADVATANSFCAFTYSARAAAAKKTADDAQTEQQKEVSRLQKIQDDLMRELMSARKVRTTLEQQRALALLEESQANTATFTPNGISPLTL